jgi:hypothetical protein
MSATRGYGAGVDSSADREEPGVNDFDFLVGTWSVANRRLTERLAGSDDWEEFPGSAVAWRFFGGAGSFDEITFPTKGHSGMTVRLYDPVRREWSLYWANSKDGLLQPPVTGRFEGGRGEFYGDDTWEGKPIRVRYIWSEVTPTSARWEQAFSTDGERTWETNWIMQFSRTA